MLPLPQQEGWRDASSPRLISEACFTLFPDGSVSLHFGRASFRNHCFQLAQLGLITLSLRFRSSGPAEVVLLGF